MSDDAKDDAVLLAASLDGRIAVAGPHRERITVLDRDAKAVVFDLPCRASSLAFLGGWLAAACPDDRAVRIWDERGVLVREHPGVTGPVAFAPEALQWATADADAARVAVSVREIETGRELHRLRLEHGPPGLYPRSTACALALSPDGRFCTVRAFWERDRGAVPAGPPHEQYVHLLCVETGQEWDDHPASQVAIVACGGGYLVVTRNGQTEVWQFPEHMWGSCKEVEGVWRTAAIAVGGTSSPWPALARGRSVRMGADGPSWEEDAEVLALALSPGGARLAIALAPDGRVVVRDPRRADPSWFEDD